MIKASLKYALLALAAVSMSFGAGCKKADNSGTDMAAGVSAPAAMGSTMGASGPAAASGAKQ